MGKRVGIVALLILVSLVAATGCAVKKPEPPYSIWPLFPNEPRLVFQNAYTGGEDIKAPVFFDYILGKPSRSDFTKPYGVFADQGKIYIVESQPLRPQLVVLNTAKERTSIISGGDFGVFKSPIGVVAAPNGDIYVSDSVRGSVYVFDKDGDYQTTLDKPGAFKKPAGMALDNNLKRIYIADTGANTVYAYSLSGNHLFSIGSPGNGPGNLHGPTNVAVNTGNGNVVVVDTLNWRVQVFDSDGKFVRTFGEIGDGPGQFTRPKGVGIDSEGHIYVVDAAFDNIQIFTSEGQFLGSFGSTGANPGYFFNLPAGLYIDGSDKLYVTEQLNGRVQVFQYLSDAWKKANPQAFAEIKKRQEEELDKIKKMLEQGKLNKKKKKDE